MKKLCASITLAGILLVPTAAQAKPSVNQRIRVIAMKVDALIRANRQLSLESTQIAEENVLLTKRVRDLENVDAGLKNTLMCLHAVPLTPFMWPEIHGASNNLQLNTSNSLHDWVVTVDDYCLVSQDPWHAERIQLPVEPPTFFPENH